MPTDESLRGVLFAAAVEILAEPQWIIYLQRISLYAKVAG
jgi:hypothetical protein